jgi:predicted nucleotidyltransferase
MLHQSFEPAGQVSSEMCNHVVQYLLELQEREQIRVLYACESGSRAWGFASKDSDYDVRFLYVRKPAWYLSIQKRRDVIEQMVDQDLDVAGWDLPKALSLYAKCNPCLMEWLDSPIVYMQQTSIAQSLREMAVQFYSPIAATHHYLNMARNNWNSYLNEREMVLRKKYLYAIRPVLACLWIDQFRTPVPTYFFTMLDELLPDGDVRRAIDQLLIEKAQSDESTLTSTDTTLHLWLIDHIQAISQHASELPAATKGSLDELDSLYRRILNEAWQDS